MKKLSIILGLLLFCAQTVLADEVSTEQTANDNRAVMVVQKQLANAIQKQEIKQNKWCVIIQINGKVKDNEMADK